MPQESMLYLGAVALGALHAFEPGHGKTLIAAYMIGSRGRALDGIILGLIVTFTHTFSVVLLGIVAQVLSHNYSDAELHGWLGLFSSLLVLGVGLWMLKSRLSGGGHSHVHLFRKEHHHGHRHQEHDKATYRADGNNSETQSHTHCHNHNRRPAGNYSRWNLLVLGVSGGLVPCPAAIATLLAAIGAGKIAKGLLMALFFSLGLGVVMMIIGVVLSQAGKLTKAISSSQEFSRRMGIASAFIITILGLYTLFHSLQTLAVI